MEHQRIEKIGDKARVWVVTRGPDGKLQQQLDPDLLAAQLPADVAGALIGMAAEIEIGATRVW
jgi:hypothetical protein